MPDFHTTVEQQIREVIADLLNYPVETVDQEAGLSDLSGLDSLTLYKILDKIEAKFNISLDESELYEAGSLSDMTQLVADALADRSPDAGETAVPSQNPTTADSDPDERQ